LIQQLTTSSRLFNYSQNLSNVNKKTGNLVSILTHLISCRN